MNIVLKQSCEIQRICVHTIINNIILCDCSMLNNSGTVYKIEIILK